MHFADLARLAFDLVAEDVRLDAGGRAPPAQMLACQIVGAPTAAQENSGAAISSAA